MIDILIKYSLEERRRTEMDCAPAGLSAAGHGGWLKQGLCGPKNEIEKDNLKYSYL